MPYTLDSTKGKDSVWDTGMCKSKEMVTKQGGSVQLGLDVEALKSYPKTLRL